MEESSILVENITPKRRGRPRKKPLPSTPSSPPYSVHVQENLSLAVVSAENSHEEDGTRNSTHLEEKETPRKRGRPGKNVLPATPSSPPYLENVKERMTSKVICTSKTIETNDTLDSVNQVEDMTPKRRGRPKKNSLPPTPSSPLCSSSIEDDNLLSCPSSRRSGRKVAGSSTLPVEKVTDTSNTPVSRRGKKRKAPSPDDDESSNVPSVQIKMMKNVICGVCQKEMPEPNFTYHRYSVHYGLARPEGASQVFTEIEKAQELKKTLEKIKRLSCSKCTASFTTLLGFQYHQKRCGVDATDLQNMLKECNICGKRVMALPAHLKTHEKRPEKIIASEVSASTPSPITKSKRAAAQKAASLLKEIKEDQMESVSAKLNSKAEKFFTNAMSTKVSNGIIAVWKKEIASKSSASCRFPGCSFNSDSTDRMKEHHVKCEVGLSCKAFRCLKCTFSAQEKSQIIEHVLNTHVSERDAAFELNGDASSDDTHDENEDEDEFDSDGDGSEGEKRERRKSIPHNTKTIDKAYGLSCSVLQQFKTLTTSVLIPKWLAEFHKKNFCWNSSLYKDWRPCTHNLGRIPSDGFLFTEESLPFARREVSTTNFAVAISETNYERLRKFEAKLHNGTPVFFCGGPIHCVAWCPMPFVDTNLEREQYLALSTFREEHRTRSACLEPFESVYVIQIWNCGLIRNASQAQMVPRMELCIEHKYGRIWTLIWCPSGCYDQERLGLLAAACSDGTVRIFSVPKFPVTEENKPFYLRSEPNATLRLSTKETSECISLDWDSTLGHKYVVAGFANGIVGLWDLTTKSPILRKDGDLYPVWSFYAHSSIVSAVSLSPHHSDARFIATASTDRTVKLWDRYDSAIPISISKRSRVTDIKWRRHWPGVLVCVEDVYALFRSASMFYDFGYTGNRQPLLPQNSVVWSATENEYLDVVAHSTDAGEVVAYASHFAVFDCDDKKLRRQRILILRTDLIDTNKATTTAINRMQKKYLECSKKGTSNAKIAVKEEVLESANYSLLYNDVKTSVVHCMNRPKAPPVYVPSPENMDILRPLDEPVTSINKISFNPNFESHTWMCVCGENGLVQLLRVDSPSTSKVDSLYVKEMTNLNANDS